MTYYDELRSEIEGKTFGFPNAAPFIAPFRCVEGAHRFSSVSLEGLSPSLEGYTIQLRETAVAYYALITRGKVRFQNLPPGDYEGAISRRNLGYPNLARLPLREDEPIYEFRNAAGTLGCEILRGEEETILDFAWLGNPSDELFFSLITQGRPEGGASRAAHI